MKNYIMFAFFAFSIALNSAFAGFNDRKSQEVADSGKPVAVQGGHAFSVLGGYAEVFDRVVSALQLSGEVVVHADRDTGLVATDLSITGRGRQTGSRVVVTVIRVSSAETRVRVIATSQKRFKVLQTEPWSAPVEDTARTQKAGPALEAALRQ